MAAVRLDPSGGVTVLSSTPSQGQGVETTLAQLAADTLGVAYEDVEVRMGDTAQSVFGFGAFASRQAVVRGGAAPPAPPAGPGRTAPIPPPPAPAPGGALRAPRRTVPPRAVPPPRAHARAGARD